MKQRIAAGLALAALVPAVAPAAAPLAPTGKWGLDQQKDRCVLQHAFGEGAGERTLAILPHPGRATEILLILPRGAQIAAGKGDGRVTLQPSRQNFTGAAETVLLDDGSSASRLRVDEAVLDALPKAKQLDLVITGAVNVSFALPPMTDPAAALEGCQQQMAELVEMNPAIKRHRAISAKVKSQLGHIGLPDFPGKKPQGRVVVLLTIGTDGRITDCKTAESSGDAATDKHACELTARYRFPPEHDAAGKAVPSWTMSAFDFKAPL